MPRPRFLLALFACVGLAPAADGDLNVLFVGNSLTYFSDVPGIVAEFGATANPPVTITVERVMASATSMTRHLGNGKVQGVIAKGGWTHVVLQPFGTLKAEGEAMKTYAQLIAPTKAQVVLYLTPHAVLEGPNEQAQKNLAAANAFGVQMIKDFNVWLAPANEVCLAAKKADPLLTIRHPARGKGNVHQGPTGSYLAAATLFTVLTGRSPVGATVAQVKPDKFAPAETTYTPEQARWLQAVALKSVLAYPSIGPGWKASAAPADLPDTTKPPAGLSDDERRAADLAYRWRIYEAMLKPSSTVKTEFNAGILTAIAEDFPGTPDAAKAKELIAARTKKGEKDKEDSDNKPGAQRPPE